MLRWFLFIVTIALGLAAAFYLGWVVLPAQNVEASPATLRQDYKTDYVLMVAEAYSSEDDLELAVERLQPLGSRPPEALISEALQFAAKNHYTESDLALMQALYEDVQARSLPTETASP